MEKFLLWVYCSVNRRLPHSILAAPYYIAFYFLKLTYFRQPVSIWYRNSLYFKRLLFGLSDLDLTFYIEKKLSKKTIERMMKHFSFMKKLIPILSEINFYSQEEISKYIEFANPYELMRDPRLTKRAKITPDEGTSGQKVSFILKMLEADASNLIHRFNLRRGKWIFHLQQLGIDSAERKFQHISDLEDFLKFLSKEFFASFQQHQPPVFLYKYLIWIDKYRDINSMNRFYNSDILVRSFLLFFPARWLGASIDQKCFDRDLTIIQTFSMAEQKLFCENIKCELWGLYTQYIIEPQGADLHIHLGNIQKTLDYIKNIDISSVKEKISLLSGAHERFFWT